jgi:hypothetical protein
MYAFKLLKLVADPNVSDRFSRDVEGIPDVDSFGRLDLESDGPFSPAGVVDRLLVLSLKGRGVASPEGRLLGE